MNAPNWQCDHFHKRWVLEVAFLHLCAPLDGIMYFSSNYDKTRAEILHAKTYVQHDNDLRDDPRLILAAIRIRFASPV